MLKTFAKYIKEYPCDEEGRFHGECVKWERKYWWWPFSYQMTRLYMYNHGLLHGICREWYTNGQLCNHGFYVDNLIENRYRVWYTNGQLGHDLECRANKRHGEHKAWFKDGRLMRHLFYNEGAKHGESKTWGKNGKLSYHEFFLQGSCITDNIALMVRDMDNITSEEKLIIKMKYGFRVC